MRERSEQEHMAKPTGTSVSLYIPSDLLKKKGWGGIHSLCSLHCFLSYHSRARSTFVRQIFPKLTLQFNYMNAPELYSAICNHVGALVTAPLHGRITLNRQRGDGVLYEGCYFHLHPHTLTLQLRNSSSPKKSAQISCNSILPPQHLLSGPYNPACIGIYGNQSFINCQKLNYSIFCLSAQRACHHVSFQQKLLVKMSICLQFPASSVTHCV